MNDNNFLKIAEYLSNQRLNADMVMVFDNGLDWRKFIYKSGMVIDQLDCLNSCLNIEKNICKFFVFDQLTLQCYLGIFSKTYQVTFCISILKILF